MGSKQPDSNKQDNNLLMTKT